ncbi:MAG TPA: hypothetical protein VFQ35_09580 [Polyangiaceae bacterium]|nr:hypothetical protein [Polyangiaceae bacterium]
MHRLFAHIGLLPAIALFSVGCKDEATRKCQSQLADAQQVVTAEATSKAGIERGIAAVDVALAACRAANRSSEVEQLTNARRELAAHIETLNERAGKTRRNKPTPEQVEELIKHGDSSCPRGMAYKAENSDKQIRCTGPQPIRMTFEKARDYYKSLGFRVTATESPPSLRAEYGAELVLFSFANKDEGPRCLTYYPPPQMPWAEAVARLTGAQLNRIKENTPVPLSGGDVPLRVDEGKDKLIVYLGSGCSS